MVAGDLDLWRINRALRTTTRVTTAAGVNDLNPMPTKEGAAVIFLLKLRGGQDQIRCRTLVTGDDQQLAFGSIDVTVPAGDVDVNAVQGLATPVASQRVTVNAGETRTVTLALAPVWSPRDNGWLSGEHHFHLNYGGPYHLDPSTLIPMGQAEDFDVLTPMLANLSYRFEDHPLFTYRRTNAKPWIVWSQEVRSDFFGHVGLVNTDGLFWP